MSSTLPNRPSELDRDDPQIARRLLEERILVEPEERHLVYELIADCVEACSGHPGGFGLTLGAHRIALNVGWSRALQVGRSATELRVEVGALDDDVRRWAETAAIGEPRRVKDLGGSLVWSFPNAVRGEAVRKLRLGVLASVRASLVSKGAGRNKDWQSHSAGALHVIASDLGRRLPDPDYTVGAVRRHWKIAPEVGGRLWGEWSDAGEATIGWDKLGDLRRFETRADFEVAREAVETEDGAYTRAGAGQVWQFRSIAPGDRIVANLGTREILGVGEVVGGYEHHPERGEHPHVIRVRWDRTEPIPVDKKGWRSTLLELGKAEFDELLGARDSRSVPERSGANAFQAILDRLEGAKLRFPIEQVADLLLALQTKRFVILTGISGTGKTRLAMELARCHPVRVSSRRSVAVAAEAVEMRVAPYMRKYARFVLPVELAARFDLPEKVDGKSPRIVLDYPDGQLEQTVWRSDSRNVAIVLLSKTAAIWFRDRLHDGDRFVLEPIERDGEPLMLRLSLPEVVAEERIVENLLVLPVRPDWTDQRGLLGFYNPITERYVSTPFLDLLVRAHEHPGQPFFAILDEMNLARVEHYFADFLSALESGESFALHDIEAIEDGSGEGPVVPRQIRVPDNLFFVGTVNVDESTYMFSSKVLDRAFTIEFDRVELGGDPATAEEDTSLWLADLPTGLLPDRAPDSSDWHALDADYRDAAEAVRVVHAILAAEHRHFGYRVANEIARFVLLAARQAGVEAVDAALDLALLHKVLPKMHGTQQEIEPLLDHLLAFAVHGSEPSAGDVRAVAGRSDWCVVQGRLATADAVARPSRQEQQEFDDPAVAPAEEMSPRFPRFGAKVFRMRTRLSRHGFASFIE